MGESAPMSVAVPLAKSSQRCNPAANNRPFWVNICGTESSPGSVAKASNPPLGRSEMAAFAPGDSFCSGIQLRVVSGSTLGDCPL